MAFTSDQLDGLLADMNAVGPQYAALRAATKGRTVNLSPTMAALLGSPSRRLVPILGVAVEAIADKLFVQEIAAERVLATKQVAAWLAGNSWELMERKLYDAVARDGLSFVLCAWESGAPRLYLKESFDGRSGAYAVRSSMSGDVQFTVNTWTVDGDRFVDIYFADRIEKYIRGNDARDWGLRRDAEGEQWPVSWVDADGAPMGLALIPFGDGESLIAGALQLQADFNSALMDMMAISRSQGWPQRFVTGEGFKDYLTNPNGQPLTTATGRVIPRQINTEPGSVLNLGAAELRQLAAAGVDVSYVRELVSMISLITGVPSHVFTGDWPSGIALQTAETRLNSKVEGLQGVLSSPLVDLARLMLRMSATFGGPRFDAALKIEAHWASPQIETAELQAIRNAETRELYTARLMSLPTAVARLHPDWTAEQVAVEVALISGTPTPTEV